MALAGARLRKLLGQMADHAFERGAESGFGLIPDGRRRDRDGHSTGEAQERRFSSSIRTSLVGVASPQRQSTRLRSVDKAPRAKDGTRSPA